MEELGTFKTRAIEKSASKSRLVIKDIETEDALALTSGVVVRYGEDMNLGGFITIDYGDGYEVTYSPVTSVHVKLAEKVLGGQPVAGVMAFLRLDFKCNGDAVDPTQWLRHLALNAKANEMD